MERIYLASRSPRRAELLGRLGIAFEIISPEVEETVSGSPDDCVRTLAERKAAAGAVMAGEGWVLAADTLVFLDGEALGKPQDPEEARRMLRRLSGRRHQVRTGMCLMNARTGEKLTRVDGAQVEFDDLTPAEIDAYVRTGEPLDKAGAYGIQGLGGALVRGIQGDYYATVGLSLCGLRDLLRRAGLR